MLEIKNKNISLNRGEKITIQLTCGNSSFEVGDKIKFSIMEKGNSDNVIFQKIFISEARRDTIPLTLEAEETKIGEPIKTGYKDYWYEIELNEETTLIGYDNYGPKLFILWPESGKVE